jgi:aspartate kinase
MVDIHIASNANVAKITLHSVPDKPGIAAEIFGKLGKEGFNVEQVISSPTYMGKEDISFAVAENELGAIETLLDKIKAEIGAEKISTAANVALVSIAGHQLAQTPGIAGKMFHAISKAGINIDTISTSMSSVTCMIARDKAKEAVDALRKEFQG